MVSEPGSFHLAQVCIHEARCFFDEDLLDVASGSAYIFLTRDAISIFAPTELQAA